jgi:hypothetical protein
MHYNNLSMPFNQRHEDELTFSSSARRDLRIWGMFIIGAVFVWAALTVHPDENCNSNGECAPWLLPIAFAVGALFGLSGLATLIVNPNRGSRIDPETGELIWWQNRAGASGGDEGRIAPEEISLIRVDRGGEGKNQVHLYNREGERQFYFDEEVIGWDAEAWSEAMRKRWPHINVDLRD